MIHSDEFLVKDGIGPYGFVIIKDKNGKVLVKNHNMVVGSGRSAILGSFINGNNNINSVGDKTPLTGYSLSKLNLVKQSDEVSISDKISERGNILTTISLENNCFLMEKDDNTFYLKIVFNYKQNLVPEGDIKVSAIELVMSKNDEEDKLFSKIKFDPISIEIDSEVNLTYYVYF